MSLMLQGRPDPVVRPASWCSGSCSLVGLQGRANESPGSSSDIQRLTALLYPTPPPPPLSGTDAAAALLALFLVLVIVPTGHVHVLDLLLHRRPPLWALAGAGLQSSSRMQTQGGGILSTKGEGGW